MVRNYTFCPILHMKKFERTNEELKKKYLEYLSVQTHRTPTIAGFCEYCGINRKTFYAHYESVNALLSSIIIDQQMNLRRHYKAYMDLDLSRDVKQMAYYFGAYMVEEEAFYRIVFNTTELNYIYQEIFDFFVADLGPVFDDYKFTGKDEMHIVIQCFAYALFSPYIYAAKNNIPFQSRQLQEMTLKGFNIQKYIKVPE